MGVNDTALQTSALGATATVGTLYPGVVSALPMILIGTGSPAGVVAGVQGQLYIQTDGPNGTAVWTKASGGVTPGTTGWQLLTAGAALFTATLTNAQVQALNSVPVVLAAAPGAGFVNVPIVWALDYTIGASAMSANPTIGLRYQGDATVLAGNATTLNSAGTTRLQAAYLTSGALITGARATYANKALVLQSSVDITGGDNNNIFRVSLSYLTMPVAA